MKKEFLIERGGKTFALYAGLLDLAHETGLQSIRTALVQVPDEGNGFVAICTATVEMAQDSGCKTFTGIGDAATNNVARAMQTALIRMSETRAKARALRDAVNIGAAAFEELGPEERPQQSDETQSEPLPKAPASQAKVAEAAKVKDDFQVRLDSVGWRGTAQSLCALLVNVPEPKFPDYRRALELAPEVWIRKVSEFDQSDPFKDE